MILKTCTTCQVAKPLEAFHKQQGGAHRKAAACIECRAAYAKRRRAAVTAANLGHRPTVGDKLCRGCNRTLPVLQFNVGRTNKDGLQNRCRECMAAHLRAKYAEDPEAKLAQNRQRVLDDPEQERIMRRRNRIRRIYRVSGDWYDETLAAQGGRCAICGTTDPGVVRGGHLSIFRVDHCHKTGAVRGLLCHPCNAGIGLLGDDPQRIDQAAAYLRRHQGVSA